MTNPLPSPPLLQDLQLQELKLQELKLQGLHPESLHLIPMLAENLPQVLAIEQAVYPFPWTHGQFLDCLQAGYCMRCLVHQEANLLLGYTVAMLVVDEWHVLNLALRPQVQGRGLGRFLLNTVVADAQKAACQSVLLEVRASNAKAQRLYQSHGFVSMGVRKQYYPAVQGREDALVMVLPLQN
jgi:ribosomal-protein-alanine N-acetyltransferase